MLKCSICGNEIANKYIKDYMGNNPYPIRTNPEDRCCDDCNTLYVIPARIVMCKLDKEDYESIAEKLNTADIDVLNTIIKL